MTPAQELNTLVQRFRVFKESEVGSLILDILSVARKAQTEEMIQSEGEETIKRQGAAREIGKLLTSLQRDVREKQAVRDGHFR